MTHSYLKDELHRFLFEEHPLRGEIVNASDTFNKMLANHNFPAAVESLLGELLVATSLLTATLKFEGDITVQIQGDGPVQMAVINGNHLQQMRGTAKVIGDIPENPTLKTLFPNGYLVITITPKEGERYQGVVGLDGETLSECLDNYFVQSEQLGTRLFLFSNQHNGKRAAAGMLLQVLPAEEDKDEHFFEHISQLTQTIKAEELYDLSAQEVLYRLYHQDEVRVFEPQPISFRCLCSEERCLSALATLSPDEINEVLEEQNVISMNCDFCAKQYQFDADRVRKELNLQS